MSAARIFSPRLITAPVAAFALSLVTPMAAQTTTLSVSDASSTFSAIKGVDGNVLTDPLLDQQTGQSADDFVGNLSTPGFMIKNGLLAGVDAMAFRVRLNTYDVNALNQMNLRLGFDADRDGDLDLYFGISTGSGGKSRYLNFYQPTPGTLNVSPSTSGFTAMAATHTYEMTASTFNYEATTNLFTNGGNAASDTNDALLTFIVTFPQINSALTSLYGASTTVSKDTLFLFVAITSTQGNTVNQDAYGYDGIPSGSTDIRYDQTIERITGTGTPVPEPATWASTGAMLLLGGALWWRRRRQASA